MTPVIELNRYQTLDHVFTFDGTDLTGATFALRDPKPAALADANIELLQAAAPASVRMFSTREVAAQLAVGGGNHFILEVILPNGSNIVLPKIGIKVT